MASLPLKNTEYIFYLGLVGSADPNKFVTSPTIAADDFQVSTDGGAFANLTTLPIVDPAGSIMVKVVLTAAEMNGEKVNIVAVDAAGGEWLDALITLDVPASNAETIPSDVWDEALSMHNIAGSTGKALRQIKEGTVSAESQINDAAATTTSFVTDLTEVADDFYMDTSIVFINSGLAGQSRSILGYNGTTKTLTLDEPLTSPPPDGAGFIIKTDHVHPITQIVDGVWGPVTGEAVAEGVATLLEIQQGDRIETNTRLIINREGTGVALIDKEIIGSLLTQNVTIRTTDT